MFITKAIGRIARGDLHYLLGRFKAVRVSYSRLQGLRDRLSISAPLGVASGPTLFPSVDVEKVIDQIRREAVYIGLQLPPQIVAKIAAFGRSAPLHTRMDPNGPTFFYNEVTRGYAPDGRPAPIGGIHEPERCEAVRQIIDDPVLRAIVSGYLGYKPRRVLPILDWSFGSDFTDEERRQLRHHVIDYHFDVGGYNFVYANFYIVDTDRYSGAHAMVRRSHNSKPLRMLLGSAVASAEAVRKQFGVENEITIEGPAGTGFVQDASCYHRATPPTRGDRLMLALRFS